MVAGPAGVGKTTVLKQLLGEEQGLVKAVSVTTRPPRDGEVDGVSYHFWDDARFQTAAGRGEFLEHATVHGVASYGTLARFVDEQLDSGLDVIKDIDVQGVDLVRRVERFRYPRSVAIFIMPPSREELLRRLRGRGSESEESVARRIRTAEAELARAGEYDYQVVNDTVEQAVARLKAIRTAEHGRQ